MSDDELSQLRAALETTSAQQVALKRQREDMHTRIVNLNAEVQRTNAARKELDLPYKNATERVADLTAQIVAEEQRRAAEAAAARAAEKAAADRLADGEVPPA